MRTQPIPLPTGFYSDETQPYSQQDVVNYLPCFAEMSGTRTPQMLKTPPGLRPFVGVGTGRPTRGTYNAEGKLLSVTGGDLYRIEASGATQIGAVPGIGRVTFAHNQISLGNEIVVVNGSAGYCYDTVADTFARITDPGFPGAAIVRFIDSYIVGIEPQGRFAFNSRPAAATDYNTLDRFTSEVSPDKLISLAVSNNELLLLSTSSGEFFENTGAAEQPFRSKRITIDKGCAGAYVVVEADNTVFWLGSDGYFYKLAGYTPQRISSRPIEQAIRGLDWSQAFGGLWEDSGHTVVYWTFPDGQTWGFDAAASAAAQHPVWHRRESYQLDRWRMNSLTRWNDEWYAGDFQTGTIWKLDWDYILEGCDEFVSAFTCPVLQDNQNLIQIPRLEVVMDVGHEATQSHGGFAISGTLGDYYVGDVVSFQYTVTPAYPGQAYTALVATGLPAGLTMDGTGLVTGTVTTDGSYAIALSGMDDCGDSFTYSDTGVVSLTGAQEILSDGPIAYWKLNETSGTAVIDYSGYARDLTVYGAPVQTSGGMMFTKSANGAWSPTSIVPSFVGSTVSWATEAIIRMDNDTAGSIFKWISGFVTDALLGSGNHRLILRYSSVRLDTAWSGSSVGLGSAYTPVVGTEFHVLVSFDHQTSTMSIYINGVLDASAVVTPYNNRGTQLYYIGFNPSYPNSYGFIGRLHDIACYDHNLSAARALAHAQAFGFA